MKFIASRDFQGLPTNVISSEVDRQSGLIVIWEIGDTLPTTLAEHKAFARAKLYAIASNKIASLTSEYHPTEQVGWFAKLREASDYQETNDSGLCPTLLAIATLRGVTLQSLVSTVLAKAAELQSSVNLIDAERGRLCDLVDAAESIEDVKNITWE